MYPFVPLAALIETRLLCFGYNFASPKSEILGVRLWSRRINVVWLDVEVENLHVTPLMQVIDASSNVDGNIYQFFRGKDMVLIESIPRENILIEWAIGHVLVDESPFGTLGAKPNKLHHIDMVNPSYGGYFIDEFITVALGV